jgi:hypothetical protein
VCRGGSWAEDHRSLGGIGVMSTTRGVGAAVLAVGVVDAGGTVGAPILAIGIARGLGGVRIRTQLAEVFLSLGDCRCAADED